MVCELHCGKLKKHYTIYIKRPQKRTMRFLNKQVLIMGCWSLLTLPALSQVEQLYYPATPVKSVFHGPNVSQVQLVTQPFGTVLQHYLKKSQEPEWDLLFPSVSEMNIWWQALQKSQKPPVVMLSLVHLKSKINFNLTIGALVNTRPRHYQTIITIYESKRSFGQAPWGRKFSHANGQSAWSHSLT